MTSKRLEQYNKLVGNFKAAKEFGYKVTGYAEWPTICIDNADKLASACADLLARLEIAAEALDKLRGPDVLRNNITVDEALDKILSDEEVK